MKHQYEVAADTDKVYEADKLEEAIKYVLATTKQKLGVKKIYKWLFFYDKKGNLKKPYAIHKTQNGIDIPFDETDNPIIKKFESED